MLSVAVASQPKVDLRSRVKSALKMAPAGGGGEKPTDIIAADKEQVTKSVREMFEHVVCWIQETPLTPDLDTATTEEKLLLYGLYKHVTVGACSCDHPAPSIFRLQAYAKHQAWSACRELTSEAAMEKYIRLAASQDNWLGEKCNKLLETMSSETTCIEENVVTQDMPSSERSNQVTTKRSAFTPKLSSTQREKKNWLGIQALIPRGQLDISFSDIAFGAYTACCGSMSTQRYNQLESSIMELWRTATGGRSCVVGFSVRSLLDLYLTVQQYPKGSEVIVTPPINVPGMLHVLKHHGINLVAVDLPNAPSNAERPVVKVDVDAVVGAVTSKTVAILVVHPFGMISATDEEMSQLESLSKEHNIHLFEDCAEIFTGLGRDCYTGSPHADLCLFSFGLIKTATALGGGVVIAKDPELARRMNQLQKSIYRQQSRWAFLWRIFTCFLFSCIAKSALLYGLISSFCHWLGLNFDSVVTSAVRSFSSSQISLDGRRQMPCPALLELLYRRLRQSKTRVRSIPARIQRCQRLTEILEVDAPSMIPQKCQQSHSTYWLYPVLSQQPAAVCRRLHQHGFDSTRGLSQLQCVGTSEECPRASQMMDRVLYLPVSGQTIPDSELRRLVNALLEAEQDERLSYSSESNPQKAKDRSRLLVVPFSIVPFVYVTYSWRLTEIIRATLLLALSVCLALLVLSHVLRWSIAAFYIDSSTCFARYSRMLSRPKAKDEKGSDNDIDIGSSAVPIISSMDALQMPSCKTDEPRRVILTGATGFIGSLLLRDLLLHREALSISQVLVVCRPKNGVSAEDRIVKILNRPHFSILSDDEKRALVQVLVGDVTKPNAGLSDGDLAQVRQDLTITHVFHCAASVSFTQTLKDAATCNISSSLYLQKLASSLPAKDSQFVHVSTAFVHGSDMGTESSPLPERLYPLGDYEPWRLYKSMLTTQFYASKAMGELGFLNTYTFSKCVCEHLLSQNSEVDTTIVRPTIVGPSLENPQEGWAGSKPSTLIAAACLYLAYQWNLWSFGNQRVPCIPVDVVTRFILVKAFAGQPSESLSSTASSDEVSSSDGSYEKIPRSDSPVLSCDGSESAAKRPKGGSLIYNAAWDNSSPPSTAFTWLQYAVAVTQMGSVLGYFCRPTAYTGLLVTARILPALSLSTEQFARLHGLLVKLPFRVIQKLYRLVRRDTSRLDKLALFLDLPLLFYPFMNNSFHFRTELLAPPALDGSRYLFSCTVASNMFMERVKSSRPSAARNPAEDGIAPTEKTGGIEVYCVGGSSHHPSINDTWWALTQPRGNYFIRLAGWILIKIFRATCSEVTVDATSLAAVASLIESQVERVRIIVAPTHRSFFDFLVLSFILFSVPELQLALPFIAAADDFEKLPIIGFLARQMGAFFLRRGLRREDSRVRERLRSITSTTRAQGPVVEVFIEGSRSRDRRFLDPKTGFLRCSQLQEEEGVIIVPIAVNYEHIPEQGLLSIEASGGKRTAMSLGGLLTWLWMVAKGKVSLGRVHVAAGEPLLVIDDQQNVRDLTNSIQRKQQEQLYVSEYHIEAASRLLDMDPDTVRKGLSQLGCKFWPQSSTVHSPLHMPTDKSELATILLQASPFLSRIFNDTRPEWSHWLCRLPNEGVESALLEGPSIAALSRALSQMFDEADAQTERALSLLKANGFPNPNPEHVLQAALLDLEDSVPKLFQCASVSMRLRGPPKQESSRSDAGSSFVETSRRKILVSGEALGFWGFHDSSFHVKMSKSGSPYVTMQGNRYSLSDRRVTNLLPFIEEETQVRINLLDEAFSEVEPGDDSVPPSRLKQEDIDLLRSTVGHVSVSPDDRIRHGTGHSQEDIFLIRSGQPLRVPDAVVSPASEDGVAEIVRLATAHSWCLIPFGGGTNVSKATRCPPLDVEPRPILSVDMKKLDRILWIDEENGLARVEAGITGRALVQEMASRGYTIGHEPDSIEFSTLGGWIATKASGMKRNKYGNIEDIVKSTRVCGAGGFLQHGKEDAPAWGRESSGPDFRDLLLGSEGCLGIITSAVVRIWPSPDVQDHDGILLADFDTGTSFVRNVSRLDGRMPVSVRLLDNEHFRLGQALSPEPGSALTSGFKSLMKFLIQKKTGMDWNRVVLVTVTYEGSKENVQAQKNAMGRLSSRYGGVHLAASTGKSCYDMTFMIAYLRDFAMTYHCLGESFETFAPWSKIASVVQSTKERIRREHAQRLLPGRPFIGCRITQLYHEGVCLYFYFCMNFENVKNPSQVFAEIELAARQEILDQGGSLSHHHGVGKLRSAFLQDIHSPALQASAKATKKGMDPNNIFGARNGIFADVGQTIDAS